MKLREIPNTRVKIKNYTEWNEWVDMCEEVGWTWNNSDVPVKNNDRYWIKGHYIEIKNNFMQTPDAVNCMTLTQLKEKLCEEETMTECGTKIHRNHYPDFFNQIVDCNTLAQEYKAEFINNNNTMYRELSQNKDQKALEQARLIDDCGNLTCKGQEWVIATIALEKQKEMLAYAKELNKEEKAS